MVSSTTPRIAVDAMGGDHGPAVVVPGVVAAARQLGERARILLVGDQDLLRAELEAAGAVRDQFELIQAPDNIGMSEAPAAAIRRRPQSSIVVAANLMKQGEVDAFVSAGSTGAVAAAALLIVGRLPRVRRPAIATVVPTKRGTGLLLDVGANVDCKPRHLLQFAAMGRIYAGHVLGLTAPSVGLLNIGEEPSKGNELAQEAHRLLVANEPAFIGNIEGRDLFEGKASVIVMDGFVGNVVLKILESTAGFLYDTFRDAIRHDLRAQVGAWLARPSLKQYARRWNYAEYGGAPLLGCRGVTIICHGGSSPVAITNAIRVAERGVRDGIPDHIADEIEREEQRLETTEADGAVDGADARDTPDAPDTPNTPDPSTDEPTEETRT